MAREEIPLCLPRIRAHRGDHFVEPPVVGMHGWVPDGLLRVRERGHLAVLWARAGPGLRQSVDSSPAEPQDVLAGRSSGPAQMSLGVAAPLSSCGSGAPGGSAAADVVEVAAGGPAAAGGRDLPGVDPAPGDLGSASHRGMGSGERSFDRPGPDVPTRSWSCGRPPPDRGSW
jgi:hypothetical protein